MAKFSKTNQPTKRRAPGNGWRQKILNVFTAKNLTEEDFIALVIQKATDPDDKNAMAAMSAIINRLSPPQKPVLNPIYLSFPAKATPVQKIDAVVQSVADGDITPDVGAVVVGMIKAGQEVLESTELAERLERLEKLLEKKKREDD